jgi:hypothetical protein
MDLSAFFAELTEEFTELRLEHGGGSLYLPRAPVDVGYVAMEHFPDDLDDLTAYDVLKPIAGIEPLITFEWDEGTRSSFDVSLDLMPAGDRTFVTLPPDEAVDQAWEAFAAVENPKAVEILDALYFDLMWDNGESYSIELMSSLPTAIRSSMLGKETIRAGFHLYLDWDETRAAGAWTTAAEHLPDWMRTNQRLASAADELVKDDTEEHRDQFIESYIDVTFGS